MATTDKDTIIKLHRSQTEKLIPTIVDTDPETLTPDFYKQICDKLLECAEDQAGLDVYQMTAFYKYYHTDENDAAFKYMLYAFKSMLCCMIQTVGMVAFLYNILVNMPESVLECTINKPWHLKLLATLFSLYIGVQMISLIKVRKCDGMYEHIAFSPPFLASEWLYLGLYSNFFALITSIYGSFLIIYSAQNAVDMVLNCVALYFVMDLDGFIIDHFDYVRVKNFMKNEFKFNEYYNDDWYDHDEGNVRFVHVLGMPLQVSGPHWNKCAACCALSGGLCMIGATAIGLIGAFAAPIAIGICY